MSQNKLSILTKQNPTVGFKFHDTCVKKQPSKEQTKQGAMQQTLGVIHTTKATTKMWVFHSSTYLSGPFGIQCTQDLSAVTPQVKKQRRSQLSTSASAEASPKAAPEPPQHTNLCQKANLQTAAIHELHKEQSSHLYTRRKMDSDSLLSYILHSFRNIFLLENPNFCI